MNVFADLGIEELVAHRDRLRSRIISGQRTGLALAPGMKDDYADKTEAQLKDLFRQVREMLHSLDPDNYDDPADDPLPTKRMRIRTDYPASY